MSDLFVLKNTASLVIWATALLARDARSAPGVAEKVHGGYMFHPSSSTENKLYAQQEAAPTPLSLSPMTVSALLRWGWVMNITTALQQTIPRFFAPFICISTLRMLFE